jgi:hypothetical protein
MELFRVEEEIASLLPGLTVEELHAFADTIQDPICSDTQIELFIHLLLHLHKNDFNGIP